MTDRRPRLLFINRSYWPDVEATGQLLTELCEDLAERFDVTVIAGQPNVNAAAERFVPRGKSMHNGVHIERVSHTQFNKASFWGRACNQVSFLLAAAWRSLDTERPDVVIAESDPPLLCLLGALLKRRHGCRLIAYLQDIYPDVAVALGALREGWLTAALRRAFRAALRQVDVVIVPGHDMRRWLAGDGIAAKQIECVPNWIDTSLVRPTEASWAFRAQQGWQDKFVVMYSGNLGLSQRLDDVLEAAARLRLTHPQVQIVLIGDGARKPALEARAAERQLANVQFLPYQPKARLSESLGAADLHLIPVDSRVTNYLFPSKLYGILAAGRPALVIAPSHSEIAQLVHEQDCGRAVEPQRIEQLAAAVAWYVDQPDVAREQGRRARQLAEREYDRRLLTSRFAELLDRLTGTANTAHAANDVGAPRRPAEVVTSAQE
ncbi:MAG: glycosyltransferase family 4 protein [Planctomycetes bacterium]|nr:glycosyltransferase family 4 protein [Planctomycetota bacterium]